MNLSIFQTSRFDYTLIPRVLACLALATCIVSVEASEAQKIRYIYPDQVVLTTKRDAFGRVKNPLAKVASTLFDKAGYVLEQNQYPASRMFQYLAEGKADFAILVKAPLLEDCCLVSEKPVTTTELRVYFRQGTRPVEGPEDLIGQSVITLRGYSYGQLKPFLHKAENRILLSPTASHESAFAMLQRGRADYLLNYKQPSIEVLQRAPIADIAFRTLKEIDLYLVLHKDFPQAAELMVQLESIISNMDVEAILNLPTDQAPGLQQ